MITYTNMALKLEIESCCWDLLYKTWIFFDTLKTMTRALGTA